MQGTTGGMHSLVLTNKKQGDIYIATEHGLMFSSDLSDKALTPKEVSQRLAPPPLIVPKQTNNLSGNISDITVWKTS